jgi:hypothetical protein
MPEAGQFTDGPSSRLADAPAFADKRNSTGVFTYLLEFHTSGPLLDPAEVLEPKRLSRYINACQN